VVLDKWKVVYVVTPKAMCTSMLWLTAGLQSEDLGPDVADSRAPEVTRALAAHDPAVWRRTAVLHSLPADVIDEIIGEDAWFRFCLTRHPVDRLWSAWQSKLLLREPAYAAWFGSAPWFPRTPAELPQGAGALHALAEDFERFVAALAEDPHLLTADQHWAPQSYLLRPEAFPYTEIGRVEKAAVTVGRLERHLRAQGWPGELDLKRRNTTLLPRAVIRDAALLRLIEDIYAEDMTTFGYGPARAGRRPSGEANSLAVQALAELVDRHERIGDLHRMLAPGPARPIVAQREPRIGPAAGPPAPPVASPSRPTVSVVFLSDADMPDAITLPNGVEAVIVPSRAGDPPGPAATGPARVIPAPSAPGAPARFQAGLDATSGDVVVFCRDVAALSGDWAERVCESLDDQEVGLVSALIQPETDPQLRLAGLEFVDQMFNVHWIARTMEESGPEHAGIEVPLLSSTFLAVRRATLTYLGGLDTGMRGDAWHDTELCLRAWRCGLRSLVLPNVVASCPMSPTEGSTSHLLHDLLRLAAVHLNQERFAGLIASLRGSFELHPALADLFTSDVGSRRARIEHIALRDAEPLLPSPATQQGLSNGVAS